MTLRWRATTAASGILPVFAEDGEPRGPNVPGRPGPCAEPGRRPRPNLRASLIDILGPWRAEVPEGINLSRELLDAMPDAIVVVDPTGRIVFCNVHLEKLAGYRLEELDGQPVEMLVPESSRGGHVGHRARYEESGRPRRPMGSGIQTVLLARDGTEIPVDIALSAIQTDGEPMVVSSVRDARERIEAQRELRDSQDRLVLLEERERIGRELHDGVIQSLFAVGMNLQATAAMAGHGEVEERLEKSVDELDRTIRDLRNYIFGLRPALLVDRQLVQAMEQLVVEFEAESGVTTVLDVDARVAADLASSSADIVQILRESLSNVARHAAATTCRVTLRRDDAGTLLEIEDDGQGFEQAARSGGGQGLTNLQERALALGGEAEVQSVPGEGTAVRVRLPLEGTGLLA